MAGTAADWQRLQYDNGSTVTPIYPTAIRARKFRDIGENPYNLAEYEDIEQEIVIPADGLVEIDYLPISNPMIDTYLDVWTGSGRTGTQYTKVTGSGSLTSNQVRVTAGKQSLDFHTDRAGELAYVTVRTAGSVVTATMMNRIFAELRALSQNSGQTSSYTGVAAETIQDDSLVYFSYEDSEVKVRLAQNDDPTKYCRGYVGTGASTDEDVTVVFGGVVATIGTARDSTPPDNATLYLSHNPGFYTWNSDTDEAYALLETAPRQRIGFHVSQGNGFISVDPDPAWSTP